MAQLLGDLADMSDQKTPGNIYENIWQSYV